MEMYEADDSLNLMKVDTSSSITDDTNLKKFERKESLTCIK